MKKTQLSLIIASLGLFLSANALAVPNKVYSETVEAHNAPMTVNVIVENGKIANIMIDDRESPGAGKRAIEMLKKDVLNHQTINLDAVTGATISSAAFLQAVRADLKQAGLNLQDFSKPLVKPVYKDQYQSEIVIIGGGGAGLAAAASAIESGSKVIIIEKLGFLGGSTAVSGGGYNAVDPERQNRQGIKDSTQMHFDDTMRGGHQKNDPKLVKYLVNEAPNVQHWLEGKGVHYKPKVTIIVGGLYPRGHQIMGGGYPYTKSLEAFVRAYPDQVQIFTDTTAEELITNKDGRVIGVTGKSRGKTIKFNATKGVIITTGGFASNVKLRQELNSGPWKEVALDRKIGSTNSFKAAQGDGLVLAKKVGGELIDLDYIQLHPGGTPGTGIMSFWPSGRNRIFVNIEGDRFVNEDAPRDTLCKAILAQPQSKYWVVLNKLRVPTPDTVIQNLSVKEMISLGRAYSGNTVEELAAKIGVDPQRLKASIATYNNVVTGKVKEDALGFKKAAPDDKPLTEGPYYATQLVPAVHHTMGGIRINAKTQVLDKAGNPIPGLFAAGEVTGGIHGDNRVGGNGIADAMVFGRQAGKQASE